MTPVIGRSPMLYASTNHAWDYGWTFYQQLAVRLAAGSDVVYVDAPVSVARLRRSQLGLMLRARATAGPEPRLRVLRSPTLPAQGRNVGRRFAAARVSAGYVRRWAARAGFEPQIVWAYAPWEVRIADHFPGAKLVYWTGDHVRVPREQEILERADAILCVADPVYERERAAYGEKAHFVPVACDFDRYRAAGERAPDPALATEPRPVFGYSGWVNERVDLELVVALARARPDATVAIVGPLVVDDRAETRLRAEPNVRLLGPQEAERVPGLMRTFDVGLVPYVDSEFNRNCNPVKFYEYLALGKPVVSTDIPTLRRFSPAASVGSAETFVERALAAAGDDGDAAVNARVAIARDHSFDALAARLAKIPL